MIKSNKKDVLVDSSLARDSKGHYRHITVRKAMRFANIDVLFSTYKFSIKDL